MLHDLCQVGFGLFRRYYFAGGLTGNKPFASNANHLRLLYFPSQLFVHIVGFVAQRFFIVHDQ
jgi:hypothetical protein